MAALINVYDPQFWANETLAQLYPQQIFSGLVYGEFSPQVQQKGDLINTRIPDTMVARDVDSTWQGVEPTATNVEIRLDKWKEVQFLIGDKTKALALKDLQSEFFTPAAEALTVAVENALIGCYKDLYLTSGVAGTVPATIKAMATDPKQVMDTQNVPRNERRIVLSPSAENNYHNLFYNAQTAVAPEYSQIQGALSRRFGFDYFGSNLMPKHITGAGWTGGAGATVNAAAAGAKTLSLAGLGAGTLKYGDVFQINHGAQIGVVNYVLTADATVAANAAAVTVEPGLAASVSNGTSVTVIADHNVNLGFHRSAFALVSRPLETTEAPGAMMATASWNGVTIRVTIFYDGNAKSTKVCLDLLFGVKTLDRRKGLRILG